MTDNLRLSILASAILLGLTGTAIARDGDRGAAMFEQIDADGNGEITQAEMDLRRQAHFAEIDANSDGKITAEELSAAHGKARMSRAERMIERMDTDGDGMLSETELAEKQGRRGNAFERWDADEDGVVTKAEFDENAGKRGHRGRMGRHRGGE